jgi:chromosome segregation ATPase
VEYLGKRLECKSCGTKYIARTKDGRTSGELVLDIQGSSLKLTGGSPKAIPPAPTLEQELNILRKEVVSRDVTLQSALNRLRDTQAEFTRLNEEVEALRLERDEALDRARKADGIEERRLKLLAEVDQLRNALRESQEQARTVDALRAERDRLQHALAALQAQASTPVEAPAELQTELERQRARIQDLEHRLAEAENTHADLHADLQAPELIAACSERDSLRKRLRLLEAELEAARTQEQERATLTAEIAELRAAREQLEQDRIDAIQVSEEMRVQLTHLEAIAAESPRLKERLAALEGLQDELEHLRTLRDVFEHDLAEAQEQATNARQEVDRLRQSEAELTTLRQVHERLQSERNVQKTEWERASGRIAELEAALPEIERLREALRQTESRVAELEPLRDDLAAKQASLAALQRQETEAQQALEALRANLVERERLIAETEALLASARADNEQLAGLREELARRSEEGEGLRREHQQATEEADTLRSSLAEREQALADAAAQLEAAQQDTRAEVERVRRQWLEEKRTLEHEWEQELRAQHQAIETQLRGEQSRATQAWNTAQQEILQLRAEVEEQGRAKEQLATLCKERDELLAERGGLEKYARDVQCRLDTERTTLTHAIEESRREQELLSERLQVALQRCQDLESEQGESPQRMAELAVEVTRLKQELQHARVERDAAAADQGDIAEKLHAREAEFRTFGQRETDYQAELARVRQALNQTRQQRDLAAQVQTELHDQIETLQKQLEEAQNALPEPTGSTLNVDILKARLGAMTSERDDWRRRFTDAEREFDEERQSLHFQVDRLQKQLTSLRQVLQGLGIHAS